MLLLWRPRPKERGQDSRLFEVINDVNLTLYLLLGSLYCSRVPTKLLASLCEVLSFCTRPRCISEDKAKRSWTGDFRLRQAMDSGDGACAAKDQRSEDPGSSQDPLTWNLPGMRPKQTFDELPIWTFP